jgi:branched-chain amino acid transport system ATP-binding protein
VVAWKIFNAINQALRLRSPSQMSAPVLQLSNVESAYGPVRALRGVSLSVPGGQIVALLGPNGAGKSTVLKTISGIIDPRKGTIFFKGDNITALDPSNIVRRGLVQVPEGREVFPLLSVRDNLIMGAYTRQDKDGIARDIELAYQYFPVLRERAMQSAGLLSGGQQQMLAIARALLAKPELILLDEPSLGLSPKLTQEIFSIVLRINRDRGTSILLVEQNANMALHVADYGYVLESGRIVMEDSCARLRQNDDIKEFYLGLKEATVRDEQRWKKKKTWR